MQIVIEIPDEYKNRIGNLHFIPEELRFFIGDVIIKGIVLPKHHGKLIDADNLEHIEICYDARRRLHRIEAPAILEASESEG